VTIYRVLKDHAFTGQRGEAVPRKAGEMVDVLNRHTEAALLKQGIIGSKEYSSNRRNGKPAPPFALAWRVGIFLQTTSFYSGGRIHMYQYAWSLAEQGAEVYLLTNSHPKWAGDYPAQANLRVVRLDKEPVPADLDLVVTDSKGVFGKQAVRWVREHPGVPFVCFNFETPNWVAKFCPGYAKRLNNDRAVFIKADAYIANSMESARYLDQWLGEREDGLIDVLPPAVNTFAVAGADKRGPMENGGRPYAVWSARSPKYKGGDVAVDAVMAVPGQFDLVMFGQPGSALLKRDCPNHRLVSAQARGDREKFRWMAGARLVLAPSLFEGYGMVPAEALASGTPALVYDLPVLRQEYGDRLEYVKWGDRKAYVKRAVELAKAPPAVDKEAARSAYGMASMLGRVGSLRGHNLPGTRRVSVQLLAYWGFVPESLESVYPFADEIVVAFGPTRHAREIDDGSLEALRAFPDPDGKIAVEVRDQWNSKLQMRNWCLSRMTGNYHILLDGDEVWTGLREWLLSDTPFGSPRWLNFWHDGGHWIHDGPSDRQRWGKPVDGRGSICPHYRCSHLRRSYRFRTHPAMVDLNNEVLHCKLGLAARRAPGAVIYHLGHALPRAVMDAKHAYYLDRDGNDKGRRNRRDRWRKWDGKTGNCGDGVVAKVDWELPAIVQRALARIGAGA